MRLRPPRSTRTDTLFPDTTLFRSGSRPERREAAVRDTRQGRPPKEGQARQGKPAAAAPRPRAAPHPLAAQPLRGARGAARRRSQGRMTSPGAAGSIRLDKLLWYLLFARSRSIAQAMVPAGHIRLDGRSEERRVGKKCVSTLRARWAASHNKK